MKKLMIIMLMGIITIIPFNAHAYGVPIYQLDQPVSELNGHTLREVFEDGNVLSNSNPINSISGYSPINPSRDSLTYENNTIKITSLTLDNNLGLKINHGQQIISNKYYINIDINTNKTRNIRLQWPTGNLLLIEGNTSYIYTATINSSNEILMYMANTPFDIGEYFILNRWSIINLTSVGLENLTVEQMDKYFNLYLEAVRYELDNKEAVKDPGQYKHIFMSIYEGLTNLMRSMGSVWRFLTTPFVDTTLSDMDNLFSIDWSWDIFDVLRQWITNMAVWILQLNAVLIGTLFLILGIPLKVSILSLVFSDLVFVILGWIMIKSFII